MQSVVRYLERATALLLIPVLGQALRSRSGRHASNTIQASDGFDAQIRRKPSFSEVAVRFAMLEIMR